MAERRLLAVYADAERSRLAIATLAERGLTRIEVFAPAPAPALLAALPQPPSPVRVFTLAGGIAGGLSGLALTSGTALAWPLITGGKPILALPAFLVIAFELAILLGALAALSGFLWSARLPRRTCGEPYDPRFSADRFGVLVATEPERLDEARRLLEDAGAEAVRDA